MTLPLCEQLQKTHPELVLCESNESLLSEQLTNFSDGDIEGAFQQLASTGSLALQATEQMLQQQRQEEEMRKSKAERDRRMKLSDDKRALRKMPREQWEAEMRKRRAAEAKANQDAVAEENKKLQDLSVDDLRKLVRAQSVAQGKRPAPIRDGADGESIW